MQKIKQLYGNFLHLKVFIIFFTLSFNVSKASEIVINRNIEWQEKQSYSIGSSNNFVNFMTFNEASFSDETNFLPVYNELFNLNGDVLKHVKIEEIASESVDPSKIQSSKSIENNYKFWYNIAYERGKPKLIFHLIPVKQNFDGTISRLLKFKIIIDAYAELNSTAVILKKSASNSVLASGTWYKIATTSNGIHRIDYTMLKNMGINVENIDPRNISIYGNGAGMLPQSNAAYRTDDLAENAIIVNGEEDGKFNIGDFIAFYGQSQTDFWRFDKNSKKFSHQSNIYSDTTYYFLTIGSNKGKRVQKIPSASISDTIVSDYDYLYFYEQNKVNLIKSGKEWLGEEFDRLLQQDFSVNIPFLILGRSARFVSSVTGRSFVPSQFDVRVNGSTLITHYCEYVPASYDAPFTSGLKTSEAQFNPTTSSINIRYTFNKPYATSIGWLNYFELNARAELRNIQGNFTFRDVSSIRANQNTKFNIKSNGALNIWDISDPKNIFGINGTFEAASSTYSFVTNTDSLREFLAFDGGNYLSPKFIGIVANQNLHATSPCDLVIISHPNFIEEAERLATFHSEKQNLRVKVVDIFQIYNEFSSGSQDISAIRDFMRMMYKKNTNPADQPKYLTLLGRASFDYKNRSNPNTNFVPTFQSKDSYAPTGSYCSDDFFGLLDDNEGNWDQGSDVGELLDVGIGRLPVRTLDEARAVVDKSLNYYSSNSFGSWRSKIVFVGDDGDGGIHTFQADGLANRIMNNFKKLNVEKVFVDAYEEETSAGGKRSPDAQAAIVRAIDRGALIMNYTGHGGEVQWSKKRILNTDDIKSWNNFNSLAVFLTATCEFSRFDDPARQSAGEMVLTNPNGGGIALLTTVRLVYSGQNEILNSRFYDHVGFDSLSGLNPPSLGDIICKTKNSYTDKNTRNFTLLGDPALKLALPSWNISTTSINNIPAANFKDTLKAFQKVEITGAIKDKTGNISSDFNGEVYPTVYDKVSTYRTIANGTTNPPIDFLMQNNVIYRGKSSVTNGIFKFDFIVPKDISYKIDVGKISYYADNGTVDAYGNYNNTLIGGTSDSVAADMIGPQIKLFINDENFVNGGTSNQNPLFIAKITDEHGINTVGRGIGRDLTGVLDADNRKSIIMNDYYKATINTYQGGEVKYDFKNLTSGKHSIRFRAYDVYNNPSEANLDFVVANSENVELNNVLNYPNPFTNFTTFHFDHNRQDEEIDVQIQIFTVAGKLIKTFLLNNHIGTAHFDKIQWNGQDDFGYRLASGVYLYKVRVKAATGKPTEKFQKLVILN